MNYRAGSIASVVSRRPWLSHAGQFRIYGSSLLRSNVSVTPRKYSQQSDRSKTASTSRITSIWIPAASIAVVSILAYLYIRNPRTSQKLPYISGNTLSTLPLAQSSVAHHDLSAENLASARKEIAAIVGEASVTERDDELSRHTSSEWSTYPVLKKDAPHFVVYPSSTDQVSDVVKVCHRHRIPIVAFSGGTSLEGHFANLYSGISIDLSKMNKILKIHSEDLDVVVQPGVSYTELNEVLAPEGLFFPPDPGPGAMIGGMVGTGCSGTNAYYYGTMRDWVVNLTVVLADGTIVKTRQRPRKSSAGYDLTKLFIGSEGTLGIVTEAVLKVTTKPASESVAIAAFDNYHDACAVVISAVRNGVKLAAIELLGGKTMQVLNETGASDRNFRESPTLFIKLAGQKKAVEEQMQSVRDLTEANNAKALDLVTDEEEVGELWEARKDALFTVVGTKKDNESNWITDVAVPISRLADIVEATDKDLQDSGFASYILGHVGDGNFHTFICFPEDQRETVENLVHRMVERAIAMEGTVTGEHGVGIVKRDYVENEVGKTTVDLMRQVKKAFDPLCLLNCGKVVRMEEGGDRKGMYIKHN